MYRDDKNFKFKNIYIFPSSKIYIKKCQIMPKKSSFKNIKKANQQTKNNDLISNKQSCCHSDYNLRPTLSSLFVLLKADCSYVT